MAANVGDKLDAFARVNERTSTCLLWQGVVIAGVGYRKLVPHITGPLLEEGFQFALEQRLIKIAGNREWASGLLKLKT